MANANRKILVATRNRHKTGEIRALLGPGVDLVTLDDFPGAPVAVEDAPHFAGNAVKKAVTLANWLASQKKGEPEYVMADDSGLEVDALKGAPGVHSARFAALDSGRPGNSPDTENNAKLLRLLSEVKPKDRTGRFRCVIAFTPVPSNAVGNFSPVCEANEAELGTKIFEGACEGHLLEAPRGAGGFGYDPLFVPEGFEKTFAEMSEEEKNCISHRARALQAFKDWFRDAV